MRSFVMSLAVIVIPLTATRPAPVAAEAIAAHAIDIVTFGFTAT